MGINLNDYPHEDTHISQAATSHWKIRTDCLRDGELGSWVKLFNKYHRCHGKTKEGYPKPSTIADRVVLHGRNLYTHNNINLPYQSQLLYFSQFHYN